MATTKAVMIFGGSGFLGSHLALKLREGYKVFATHHWHHLKIPGVTTFPVNIRDRELIKRIIYTTHPDVIIYAAGSSKTDWANDEDNERKAEEIYAEGPATISTFSDLIQSKLIYLSNCYVFDGQRGNYREGDTVLPSTPIGKFKLTGENSIRSRSLNHLLVRLSPIFGRSNCRNLSFLDTLRNALARGQRVELPSNELHSFAPVSAFTDFVTRIVETNMRNKVVHFGGLTRISYYDFGVQFAQRFGYDPSLIIEKRDETVINSESNIVIEGPVKDFSLNSTYAVESFRIKPLLLEDGFDALEAQLRSYLKGA